MTRFAAPSILLRMTALAGFAAVTLLGASHAFAAACQPPAAFPKWLQNFKQQAVAQGISPQTVNYALDGITYDPVTVAKDRGQAVFAQSFLQFSGRMVSGNRLQGGGALLKRHAATFKRIEQEYGVPGPVLVAFWGLETDFGKIMGNMESIRSLATLSFDCRRPEKFTAELLDALRVIQRGDLLRTRCAGPAHGEVGQFQFQPSTYYNYAVDFDGDGRRDLIRSTPNSLASAANYLKSIGWQGGQPWLEQVRVPAESSVGSSRRHHQAPAPFLGQARRDLSQRAAASERRHAGEPRPAHGTDRPAFLTYQNFDVYTEWNNSLVYCLTAAYYASRLAGGPPLAKGNGPVSALSLAELKELQQQLAKQGFDVGKIDGVIGAASREAIRTMQVKYGLPADAYPTAELLRRLRTGR